MAVINYQTMTPLESGTSKVSLTTLSGLLATRSSVKYRNRLRPKRFEGNPEFKFVEGAGFHEELTERRVGRSVASSDGVPDLQTIRLGIIRVHRELHVSVRV